MSGLRQAIRVSSPIRPLSPTTFSLLQSSGPSLPSPADLFNYLNNKTSDPSPPSPTRPYSTKRAIKNKPANQIPGSEDSELLDDSAEQPWILDSATAHVPDRVRSMSKMSPSEALSLNGQSHSSALLPNFSSFSTAELREQMELCGLEKVVAKATMIRRLNKFWTTQLKEFEEGTLPQMPDILVPTTNRSTKTTRNPRPEKSVAEPIKKPVKRVAKSLVRTSERSPTRKSSRSPSRAKSPRRQSKSLKNRRKGSKNTVTLADQQFDLITEAVRQAAKDPNNPSSFYHKIVMYDPIIHEELTEWLNEAGLKSIGVVLEDPITVADAVKWCDIHSVCSLPKETQRGLERKRY